MTSMHHRGITVAGLVLIASALTGCGIPAPVTPESARIIVTMRDAPDIARSRTIAAFTAEGLTIATATDVLTTQALNVGGNAGTVVYRATVVQSGLGTDVILSGVFRNTSGAMMAASITGGSVEPMEFPLHGEMRHDFLNESWARLQRVAARLRT